MKRRDEAMTIRILGKLLRLRRSHPKTSDTQYIEILERLNEAKVNLENAKDSIKDRIKEFRETREYLSNELITDEFNKLDAIKYRLEHIKGIIEEIENIILDFQGS